LLAVLEEVWGVKVFHLKFEPVGTAASVRSEEYGPAILLNANNPRGRRNDDLAHELFHLLTWNVFHPASTNTASSEAEERFAGHFAANLLMPSDPFRSAINSRIRDQKIGFDSLYDVAREFDVSVDSVISRMYDLYNHLPEDNEQVQKDIKRAEEYAHILDRREDSPKPPTYPERYRALAIKAFRHGEMSTGQFAEYLNISRQEAQQFDQEVSDGEEVQVVAA
jgi:Zn-dependent peptidase ImmA (M78 family)